MGEKKAGKVPAGARLTPVLRPEVPHQSADYLGKHKGESNEGREGEECEDGENYTTTAVAVIRSPNSGDEHHAPANPGPVRVFAASPVASSCAAASRSTFSSWARYSRKRLRPVAVRAQVVCGRRPSKPFV